MESRRLAARPGWFAAGALVAFAVLLAVGLHYAGRGSPGALDRHVDDWLSARFDSHLGVALFLADLGNTQPVLVTALVLVVVELGVGQRRGVVLAVLAPLLSAVLTEAVFKPAFHRTHYVLYDPGYSYPSGHTAAAGTMLLVIAVLVPPLVPRRVGLAVVAGCLLLGVAVAAGLVAAGYHYATDTVGGAALAVAVVLGLSVTLDRAARAIRTRSG